VGIFEVGNDIALANKMEYDGKKWDFSFVGSYPAPRVPLQVYCEGWGEHWYTKTILAVVATF
jgi:hypothetical protein